MRFALFSLLPFVAVLFTVASAAPSSGTTQPKVVNVPITSMVTADSKVLSEGSVSGTLRYSVDNEVLAQPDNLFDKIDCVFRQNTCNRHCPTKTAIHFDEGYSWKIISGYAHRTGGPLCGPGSITQTTTVSTSWSVSVQVGPDFKVPAIDLIDKLGFRIGGSYTWGTAKSSGITNSCTLEYPCLSLFQPKIGVIRGWAYTTTFGTEPSTKYGANEKECSRSERKLLEIHVPMVDKCEGNNNCLASGSYDFCYITGQTAQGLCSRSKLGPKPTSHVCPAIIK